MFVKKKFSCTSHNIVEQIAAPDRTCHSALINPSSNSCSGSASCGARLRWVGQTSGVGSAVIDLFTSASSQGDVQYQVIRSTTETTMYTERRQASNGYYHNHCAICMCKDPSEQLPKVYTADQIKLFFLHTH